MRSNGNAARELERGAELQLDDAVQRNQPYLQNWSEYTQIPRCLNMAF